LSSNKETEVFLPLEYLFK